MATARSKSKVAFEPELNIALDGSRVSGSDLAAGGSTLLGDSSVRQSQRFSERGPGDQNIVQQDVQEEVVDPGG